MERGTVAQDRDPPAQDGKLAFREPLPLLLGRAVLVSTDRRLGICLDSLVGRTP